MSEDSHSVNEWQAPVTEAGHCEGPGSNSAVIRNSSQVPMWPQQVSTCADIIKEGLFALENAPPASSVYVVEGAGTTLQDGTLELGESACLVFDSS